MNLQIDFGTVIAALLGTFCALKSIKRAEKAGTKRAKRSKAHAKVHWHGECWDQ